MAGSIGSFGRAAVLTGAVAVSMIAAPGAGAQNVLEMDPYLQGRCASDPGRGFQINFNPTVNAWPVYEHTECSTAAAPGSSEPGSSEPQTEPRRSTQAPGGVTQPVPPAGGEAKRAPKRARAKVKRARCKKPRARTARRCARRKARRA